MDHTFSQGDKERLRRHVYGTYMTLRYGMAAIAFSFPLVLLGWGMINGLPLQGSMSAYYWASVEGDPPVRVWFVGGLFAISSLLFLYKGFNAREDWALNLAALFAIFVALFPMSWNCGPNCPGWSWHGVWAFALFACMVYVALRRSGDTLSEFKDPARKQFYKKRYWVTSAAMILSPVAAIILHVVFAEYNAWTYFVELCGIWAFTAFWWIKSREIRESQAEEQALLEASEAVLARR